MRPGALVPDTDAGRTVVEARATAGAPSDDLQRSRLREGFAENLVGLRRRTGRTRIEVARISGLHPTEVGLLQRGCRLARVDTVPRLALGVAGDPCELLDGLFLDAGPRSLQGARASSVRP
jgi:hypothetical protein